MGPSSVREAGALNICMACDFFYPNMGGVENHLFNLSQCLLQRGHKVVIVTHAYGDRSGVRWLSRGLKVYYLPIPEMFRQCTYTTFFSNFAAFRSIVIRERIHIIHGHQALSNLCHEAIMHGKTMGLPCVFTDHSLFGFADTSSILTNKLLQFTLSDIDRVICVSHTSRENTVLRAALQPQIVSVIPNALISEHFLPKGGGCGDDGQAAHGEGMITIVVISRLVYRKGIDLLVPLIPRICRANDRVRFLIAGDGPKKIDIEQMREEHLLYDRVEIISGVPSEDVRNVMIRGDIFLNTSLTEAFCMAILEAASCNLYIVSTNVGGIPEVLPPHMIRHAEAQEDALFEALSETVDAFASGKIDTSTFHGQVERMYSWRDVGARTDAVYQEAMRAASGCAAGSMVGARHGSLFAYDDESYAELLGRLARYYKCGAVLGKLACLIVVLDCVLLHVLECLFPASRIDIAPAFAMDGSYNGHLAEALARPLLQGGHGEVAAVECRPSPSPALN